LLGDMSVRDAQNYGTEGPEGFYVIFDGEGVGDEQFQSNPSDET
jgi:hypothetical protein